MKFQINLKKLNHLQLNIKKLKILKFKILHEELDSFKKTIEENKSLYESMLDKTTSVTRKNNFKYRVAV